MFRKSVVIQTFFIIIGSLAFAQTHFKGVSNTGNNATVAAPASSNPTILGAPLATGDEIGVFTPGGLCVGSVVWEAGKNAAIIVWGDNDQTPEIDGMRAGETLRFCLWRESSRLGYSDVSATFSSGDGLYSPNGIYVLSSLSANAAVLPAPPILSSPATGVTGLTSKPRLAWYTVCGASSYVVQIDDDQNFSSPVVEVSGVDSTSYLFSGVASNTAYYWRVRAENAVGQSGWSDERSFTTGMISGVEIISSPFPDEYALYQNYPNPFNAFTSIGFYLPSQSFVTLTVYDILGHAVATVLAETRSAGEHRAGFDASALAGGVYFYRIEARRIQTRSPTSYVKTRKLILLR
jgi:hypothetical protein